MCSKGPRKHNFPFWGVVLMPRPGTPLGHHDVTALLGEGGMGQ